jgi:hypothetical protein
MQLSESTNDQPQHVRWRFWSTKESIEADIPSIAAIVETVVAVPLYWWITLKFGTLLPLLISVVVAPLVLLRSDQSVALGARWALQLGEFVENHHIGRRVILGVLVATGFPWRRSKKGTRS